MDDKSLTEATLALTSPVQEIVEVGKQAISLVVTTGGVATASEATLLVVVRKYCVEGAGVVLFSVLATFLLW